eukprot:30918-Pelagococcus_subviridis.AAC.7
MTKITFVLRAKLPPELIARTKKRFARRFAPAFSNSCRTFRSEFATSFQVSSTSTRRHCSHARARSRPGRARRKIDRARSARERRKPRGVWGAQKNVEQDSATRALVDCERRAFESYPSHRSDFRCGGAKRRLRVDREVSAPFVASSTVRRA